MYFHEEGLDGSPTGIMMALIFIKYMNIYVQCLSAHYPTTPRFSLQVVHSEEPKAVIQVKDLLLFLYE